MSDLAAAGGRPARPEIITKADFRALAELAYRKSHTNGLAAQMAEALNMSAQHGEKNCQRWLADKGPPPPLDVIEQTYRLADQAIKDRLDALDRTETAIETAKQNPGI